MQELNPLQVSVKREIERRIQSEDFRFVDVPCAICGVADFEPLSQKDRYGLLMPVVVCRKCGLIQTSPRMSPESYEFFYKNQYRKLYVGREQADDEFFQDQYRRGRELVRYVERHLPSPAAVESRSAPLILEVGCGAGGILKNFAERGFRTIGLDLDEGYLEFGRKNHGLDLRFGTLKDFRADTPPALILYSHVFEHLLDPVGELEMVHTLLGGSGLVYIEVPGVRYIHHTYGMNLGDYLQNAHTYHFTLRTLTRLLEKGAFERLSGTEEIRSVFRALPKPMGDSHQPAASSSEFASVKLYLQVIEFLWRTLPFSPWKVYRDARRAAGKAVRFLSGFKRPH